MSVPAPVQQPAPPAAKPPRPPQIRGTLKRTIDLMVFGPPDGEDEGIAMSLPDACRKTGFHFASMRAALERPHVQRYLREQKQVFRAAVSAQNISALAAIRDKSGNAMAQLGAIKVLEQLDEEHQPGAGAKALPGLQIVIVQGASGQPATIDVTPRQAMPIEHSERASLNPSD